MLKMLYASSADELDESMRTWVDPCNNFVFGDIHGDIGYLNRGQLPVRSMANAWLPVPGWTGEHDWRGTVPFDELARSRNPETGFIVTANNRIVGQEYPRYYIALDFFPDYRARRIVDRLKVLTGATVEDMASIHSGDRLHSGPGVRRDALRRRRPWAIHRLRPETGCQAGTPPWTRTPSRRRSTSAFRSRLHRRLIGRLLGPLAEKAARGDWPRRFRVTCGQLASLLVSHALSETTPRSCRKDRTGTR